MRKILVVGAVAALGGTAAADKDRYQYDLDEIKEKVKNTAPGAGVDKAKPGPPAWCGPLKDAAYGGGFVSHLGSYYNDPKRYDYALAAAAEALCKNDPKAAAIHAATAEVLQLWMNTYGLSQADAVESIKITLDKAGSDAGKKQVCDALELDKEVGGADNAFLNVKNQLFDCSLSERVSTDDLRPWLDSSAKEPDEIVRMWLLFQDTQQILRSEGDYREKMYLGFGIDQYDIKQFDPKKVLASLDSAPYKGNAWARSVVKETLGKTRLQIAAVEAELQKKTGKDADWKEIIYTAPQKGSADWLAAAGKFKAELQRSADFEQAAYGPSKKALVGCDATLKKDLVAVLKPMKKDNVDMLKSEMNKSPVAGLLFRRYQACVAAVVDKDVGVHMRNIEGIRVVRGPRAAAYYAMIDAVGKIRADRSKFALSEHDVPTDRSDNLGELTFNLANESKVGNGNGGYNVWEEQGVVKTAKKNKDGSLAVAFAKDKQERYVQSGCKQLNRIVTWANDGRPIYDQQCSGKVQKIDISPYPITIPANLADGVAPGKFVSFGVSNSGNKRVSLPFEVYADKKGKNLVAWFGVGL